uniref:Uncharacterized protein n=1 Tax=Rhizophora mucronata TaxID=61149 RepID=A0A2P2N3X1_RHIMU
MGTVSLCFVHVALCDSNLRSLCPDLFLLKHAQRFEQLTMVCCRSKS